MNLLRRRLVMEARPLFDQFYNCVRSTHFLTVYIKCPLLLGPKAICLEQFNRNLIEFEVHFGTIYKLYLTGSTFINLRGADLCHSG